MFNTRTEQTTVTTGTGTVDLIAALTGRRNFADTIGNGNQCYYIIQTADEAQWEEGWGTVTAGSPDQLSRSAVVRSSNNNNLVNFPAGTKTVFIGDNADTIRFGSVGQLPTSSGSANALTVGYSPAVRHIRAGMVFSFIAGHTAAGGATTLALNVLSALPLKAADGVSDPYASYDFVAGSPVWVVADGTGFRILLGGPGAASRAYVDAKGTPVGAVVMFPANAAPSQFIKSNGALLSRTTYASLWAYANASGNIVADASWSASSTPGAFSYGDGSTTFRIPDLRGLSIRSFDDAAGIDTGRVIGSYQADQNQQHTHTANVTDPGHYHRIFNASEGYASGTGYLGGRSSIPSNWTVPGGSGSGSYVETKTTGITVANINQGAAEVRVKNAALLACIKY